MKFIEFALRPELWELKDLDFELLNWKIGSFVCCGNKEN